MTSLDRNKIVVIDYTNWEGKRSIREIVPTGELKFMSTLYHPEMQWILEAVDVRKGEIRHFALTDIHSISKYKEVKS